MRTRINEMINISPIRLIDEDGAQLGIVSRDEALKMAQERELDLVEIVPQSKPPVCKIIDWGKYQYQQSKKDQLSKTKQKKVDIKGIRIRPATGENDLTFKANQAKKFLEKGNKVKIEIVLRGREKAFVQQARENLNTFIDKIPFSIKIEQEIRRQGKGLNVIVAPNIAGSPTNAPAPSEAEAAK
jgi:translation initiation factor IF-3